MDVKIYKAFIASPSDTGRERILCDKIFEEINSGLGEIYKFRIVTNGEAPPLGSELANTPKTEAN